MKKSTPSGNRPPLPEAFAARMQGQLGTAWPDFQHALSQPPVVSVRSNPAKPATPEWSGLQREVIPWCPLGQYLTARPVFTLDPLHAAGAYYVQEASSMALWQMQEHLPPGPVMALDLCAAPGGKATLLASLLPEGSLLLCNEPDRARAATLQHNLWRWGAAHACVSRRSPEQLARYLAGTFDLVVADAPCSGEGLFRKMPLEAPQQWNPALVQSCALRQHDIVTAAARLVKPGGLLAYSTCTYAPEENEAQLERLMRNEAGLWHPLPLDLLPQHGWLHSGLGYQAYPHRVRGEGLYLALLRKDPDAAEEPPEPLPTWSARTANAPPEFIPWLPEKPLLQCWQAEDELTLVPVNAAQTLQQWAAAATLEVAGLPFTALVGPKPLAPWALSPWLSDRVPRLELSAAQCLHYLKGEALRGDFSAQGWVLICHQGLGLGWAKAVPGRLNNAYPSAWRIRMDVPPMAED